MPVLNPAEYINELKTGYVSTGGYQFSRCHFTIGSVLSLESDQMTVFILQSFTFVDDCFQQLPGKGTFNQIQVHPVYPLHHIFFTLGIVTAFLKFIGS